jgi:exocyst complex component 1
MQYEASLTGGSFDEGNMVKNIEACEWLTSAIKNLEASNLDLIYVKLRAVSPMASFFFSKKCRRVTLHYIKKIIWV